MARASFSIRAPAILQSLQGCAPNGWVIGFRYGSDMYFFFSNRLGCLGSLLLSAVVTVALLFLFGMLRF